MKRFEPNLERIKRDILNLSEFASSTESGHTRISFSEEDRRAREHIALLMEKEAKLKVRIDAAGNLIGRREGKRPNPAILVGSHADTVRGGGRFDGVSGVIAGLEVARIFDEKGFENIHPLEVIVFLAEEPSPFGLSTIGSRAVAGKLKEEALTSLKDDQERTLREAIREMGGNPEKLHEARRSSGEIFAYFELHIEQGPFLFSKGIPVGIVQGIVGITRGKVEVIGRNDHAGTTPMAIRKDALAAGSDIILGFERICKRMDALVGTIGRVEVFPNSLNVVPGKMVLGMDVRSMSTALIDQTFSLLRKELDRIRDRRGIEIKMETEIVSKPVLFPRKMVDRIRQACDRLQIPYLKMTSGAGHDAMHIAEISPTGMVFIPSRDGRSHSPEEWTDFEHICQGTEVLACTIAELDREGKT